MEIQVAEKCHVHKRKCFKILNTTHVHHGISILYNNNIKDKV